MRHAAIAVVIALAAWPAAAAQAPALGARALASPIPSRGDRYRQELVQLRTQYLCKRPAKEGALTTAEKAAYRARLDDLNRRYGMRHGG